MFPSPRPFSGRVCCLASPVPKVRNVLNHLAARQSDRGDGTERGFFKARGARGRRQAPWIPPESCYFWYESRRVTFVRRAISCGHARLSPLPLGLGAETQTAGVLSLYARLRHARRMLSALSDDQDNAAAHEASVRAQDAGLARARMCG